MAAIPIVLFFKLRQFRDTLVERELEKAALDERRLQLDAHNKMLNSERVRPPSVSENEIPSKDSATITAEDASVANSTTSFGTVGTVNSQVQETCTLYI